MILTYIGRILVDFLYTVRQYSVDYGSDTNYQSSQGTHAQWSWVSDPVPRRSRSRVDVLSTCSDTRPRVGNPLSFRLRRQFGDRFPTPTLEALGLIRSPTVPNIVPVDGDIRGRVWNDTVVYTWTFENSSSTSRPRSVDLCPSVKAQTSLRLRRDSLWMITESGDHPSKIGPDVPVLGVWDRRWLSTKKTRHPEEWVLGVWTRRRTGAAHRCTPTQGGPNCV